MLSERRHTVLQSLVREYVQSAHPVGSTTLVARYLPTFSPATVRNELMWLEDRGYAWAPHTSAGRVPTISGYRMFVNSLLLHASFANLNELVSQKTARYDSKAARYDSKISSLNKLQTLLNTTDKVQLINEVLGFASTYTDCLAVFWAPQISSSVFHRGLPLLLAQPEFTNVSAALPIMQLLESNGELTGILEDIAGTGGLHIKIGSENNDAQLYQFSMVSTRFAAAPIAEATISNQRSSNFKSNSFGVIALFGPTRMDYQKAISTVCSIADDLERTID